MSGPNRPDLCGDWGGTNPVPDGMSYKTASGEYRAESRYGVFR